MLRLATDEDFNNRILRGLLRRRPDLDIARAQDAGLIGGGTPKCWNGPRRKAASCSHTT